MKTKTSISLDTRLIKMIDRLPRRPSRSEVIEEALVLYFKHLHLQRRDRTDLEILDAISSGAELEALGVLEFQAPLALRAAESDE
jgi:metal-responsive CopG/Arc/MetJ family transcriptional regulator